MVHTIRVIGDADIKVQNRETHQESSVTLKDYSVTKHFDSPVEDTEIEVAKILTGGYGFQGRGEVTVFTNSTEI